MWYKLRGPSVKNNEYFYEVHFGKWFKGNELIDVFPNVCTLLLRERHTPVTFFNKPALRKLILLRL